MVFTDFRLRINTGVVDRLPCLVLTVYVSVVCMGAIDDKRQTPPPNLILIPLLMH